MTKILLLIVVAGFSLCGSVTSSADNTVLKSGNSLDDMNSTAGKSASQTVRRFMELIAAGENEKAKALMFDSKVDRETKGTREPTGSAHEVIPAYEVPPTLDWVTVLADRKFRLKKILSERSEGDVTVVETELSPEDLGSFIQKAAFELRKVGDRWRISDVDLLDKPATGAPQS